MPTDTARQLLSRLRAIGLTVHQDLTARLRHLGIAPGELEILERLGQSPGLSAPMLGRRLDLRRQSLNRQLASLEESGHVRRHFCFGDTRSVGYSLTEAGVKTLEAGQRVVRDLELQLLNQLGGRSGEQLLALLEKTQRTLRLARRVKLETEVEWDPLPDRLADMYTENGFEPFPRPR